MSTNRMKISAAVVGALAGLSTAAGACVDLLRFPGSDIDGNINRNVLEGVQSEQACIEFCLLDPGCNSAVYNGPIKTCYTKPGGIDDLDTTSGNPRLTALICNDPRDDVSVCKLARYPASDVNPGAPGPRRTNVPSEFACLQACDVDDECLSAVYVADTNICYFKAAGADERVDAIDRYVVVACAPVPTPPTPPPVGSVSIGECNNFVSYVGFDVDAGEFRTITRGVTIEECATICRRDVNCGSAVHTASGNCWTKNGVVDDRIGDGALTNLTLLVCSDPTPIPPAGACSGIERYPGYDVTPGTFLTPVIKDVFFESVCLELCLASPACNSAVHVSDSASCYLKAASVPTPLEGDGSAGRLVLLECAA